MNTGGGGQLTALSDPGLLFPFLLQLSCPHTAMYASPFFLLLYHLTNAMQAFLTQNLRSVIVQHSLPMFCIICGKGVIYSTLQGGAARYCSSTHDMVAASLARVLRVGQAKCDSSTP